MNNKLLVGIALAVLAVLGGLWLDKPEPVVVERQLGALAGPDIPYQYLNVGGLRHEFRSMVLATATTTPCALQSPAASSTLLHAGLRISTATSTATVWTASKAATAFATTTAFDQFSLGSGVQGSMFVGAASSTAPDEASVIGPSQWIVWGVQGTVIAGTANLNGVCAAEFIVL